MYNYMSKGIIIFPTTNNLSIMSNLYQIFDNDYSSAYLELTFFVSVAKIYKYTYFENIYMLISN